MKAEQFRSGYRNRQHTHSRSVRVKGAFQRVVTIAEDAAGNSKGSQMEDSAHSISKLLINAQEEERSRIARELHDAVGQELALLIVKMQCPPDASAGDSRTNEHMVELRAQAERIGTMVRSISHNLHPPELDYLGLRVAVERLCREFSKSYRISLSCSCDGFSTQPNRVTSLAVYRVLQEALHNIAKHSHSHDASVQISCTPTELALSIRDNGIGFNVNDYSSGIGLVSMRERVCSVGGNIKTESSVGLGTRIEVRVPLVCEKNDGVTQIVPSSSMPSRK